MRFLYTAERVTAPHPPPKSSSRRPEHDGLEPRGRDHARLRGDAVDLVGEGTSFCRDSLLPCRIPVCVEMSRKHRSRIAECAHEAPNVVIDLAVAAVRLDRTDERDGGTQAIHLALDEVRPAHDQDLLAA